MKRKIALILTFAMLCMSLAACGGKGKDETTASAKSEANGETKAETKEESKETKNAETTASGGSDKVYKIGVCQLVEHAALDAAYEGFVKALDDSGIKYEIDYQNAQNEQPACETIATKLVNDGNDLILAIATPAAQAVAGKTEEIPILVTAVTDPETSGLVDSNDAPGKNLTGTSDLTPVKEQIELLHKLLPDAKSVGILYCTAEDNSSFQVEIAKNELDAIGLDYEEFTVSSSNEIQTVVESMIGKVDCIYIPTDNTISSGMATVAMVANENNLPTIVGEEGMIDGGGLATYGLSYFNLGVLTGEMAVKILKGEATPAEMPIGYLSADKCELRINDETAELLGITIPDDLK